MERGDLKQKVIEAITAELSMIASSNKEMDKHIYTIEKLLDVLKENFAVEESDGFITSIEGIEQDVDEKIGWIYFINDEMAMVGAAEYELEANDEVNFDLQEWE